MTTSADPPPFHPDRLDVYLRRRRDGGGSVYLALLVLLGSALAVLPWVSVPVPIRARGFLLTAMDSHAVVAPSSGSFVAMRRSDGNVRLGDTLLVLDNPRLRSRQDALRARRQRLREEESVLERLGPASLTLAGPSTWREELAAVRRALLTIESEEMIVAEELAGLTVLAPVSGTLHGTLPHYPGSLVTAGQRIAWISPRSDLAAELHVAHRDLPGVLPGTAVHLRVEAGHSGVWTPDSAIVAELLPKPVQVDGQVRRRVRVNVLGASVPQHIGLQRALRPGAPVSARIPRPPRRLWSLLWASRRDGAREGAVSPSAAGGADG